jgi:3-dehydroquinate dehydratase-2
MNILVLNGPNLNLLGTREPSIYGSSTYEDLEDYLRSLEKLYQITIEIYQSNHEGHLIDAIHESQDFFHGIVLNAGAYTHYSYALYDAIKSIPIPVVEVHISNIEIRTEAWRKISVLKDACIGQIQGLGFQSYEEGIKLLLKEGSQI